MTINIPLHTRFATPMSLIRFGLHKRFLNSDISGLHYMMNTQKDVVAVEMQQHLKIGNNSKIGHGDVFKYNHWVEGKPEGDNNQPSQYFTGVFAREQKDEKAPTQGELRQLIVEQMQAQKFEPLIATDD